MLIYSQEDLKVSRPCRNRKGWCSLLRGLGRCWPPLLLFSGFVSFSKFIYIQNNSLGEQQYQERTKLGEIMLRLRLLVSLPTRI